MPPILSLTNVSKRYGRVVAVKDITLSVSEGEFLSIIGPSGCGKSTILKMIVGVVTPSSGTIDFRGRDISTVSQNDHGIVMVWQSLALFPHMDVQGNVGFGLAVRSVDTEKRKQQIAAVLKLVDLNGFEMRRVQELSGGEQQRVALARALIVEPEVLLLDEPLGGLDKHLRGRLLAKLREIHRGTGKTFVMVTHDQSEALSVSSRLAILNRGCLEQVGDPSEILTRPKSSFVAHFVGNKNVFAGTVTDVIGDQAKVSTAAGELVARLPDWIETPVRSGMAVSYVIDSHCVTVGKGGSNFLSGQLDVRTISGGTEILEVMVPSLGIVRCQRPLAKDAGQETSETVQLSWDPADAYVLPSGVSEENRAV